MTYDTSRDMDSGVRDPEEQQIVTEIEVTRNEMGATIDQIGHRLQPQTIAEEARGMIREATVGRVERFVDDAGATAQKTSTTMMDTIRQNPVPAAMAAMGIGWLALRMRGQSSNGNGNRGGTYATGRYDYGYDAYSGGYDQRYGVRGSGGGSDPLQNARNVAGDVAGTAQQAAQSAVQGAQQVGSDVQQAAQSAVQGAQQVVQQGQYQAQSTLTENPLAMAALALGVGAAVGLALPETQRERELMGEQSEKLMSKASEVASQALDQTQTKVEEVAQQAQSEG